MAAINPDIYKNLLENNEFIPEYFEEHKKKGGYGSTSINQLPDVLTYMVGMYKDGLIDLYNETEDFIMTDYGCGSSILSDVLLYVISEKKDYFTEARKSQKPVTEIMEGLYPYLDSVMAEVSADPNAMYQKAVENRLDNLVLQKFDPGLAKYSIPPQKKADFLVCNDVLEHIPEEDIDQTIEVLNEISEYSYINACLRPAVNVLPSGKNPHCTIKPMEWWKERFDEKLSPASYQGVFRDLTSIMVINFEPGKDTSQAALNLFTKYGEIDLIPYPHPREKYQKEPLVSRLRDMQSLKHEVIEQNKQYYRGQFQCNLDDVISDNRNKSSIEFGKNIKSDRKLDR